MTDRKPEERRVRSFVRRGGRLSGYQQEVLNHPPRDVLLVPGEIPDLKGVSLFGNDRPLIIEIGFGMGDATLSLARSYPQKNYLAFDVHRPGIGKLVAGIQDAGLTNVKVVEGDAQEILQSFAASPAFCNGFHIFFPDPWPKKKHLKRRLISSSFTACLVNLLKPGGYILAATDWEDYARQIREVLSCFPELENCSLPEFERIPWRPLTKFENKGIEKGHRIFDFLFVKKEHPYVGQ